ncbi:DNA cross-link repair 1 protein-like [Pistacia vera]|uniref:DNA cross-link repair 1 protein-like n=1 Tax=Pistacia vera TaxID=55513 RepID=UPI001263C648|nr:DNA cross-link repair 1 protein-like [Pistacia vera]XP_031287033.1 DNA cross-link repair 1 protein-like [Pistacia vera]XP_031287034.1 DNA cross-link repair 1 protein-like [Pistacia vera]
MLTKRTASQPIPTACAAVLDDDDDDFQAPLTQTPKITTSTSKKRRIPFKPSNNFHHSSKPSSNPGKENLNPNIEGFYFNSDENCSLESIPSSIDCSYKVTSSNRSPNCGDKKGILKINEGYSRNSIESRLLRSRTETCNLNEEESDDDAELDVLLKLREEINDDYDEAEVDGVVQCPLCGVDISNLSEELRQLHTNDCLDKCENQSQDVVAPDVDRIPQLPPQVGDVFAQFPQQVVDVSPVVKFLHSLGLGRYEEAFVREEIDWDTLQWLAEEDILSIGVTALGPRKKIVHALSEIRKGCCHAIEKNVNSHAASDESSSNRGSERHNDASKTIVNESSKPAANKLITDFFPGSIVDGKKLCTSSGGSRKSYSGSCRKPVGKSHAKNGKLKDIPTWCCVPGTPFRVDAFKFLRGDCSHWFLTHFHMDHYQGLTKSFCHGKIYCSLITARLVNMKIGIPWDRIQVLPLNQKITIAGIYVTCLDANHCPGSVIILFEPPDGKAVLHTGDFRFSEQMASASVLQACPIHTLILDTTYCNPQYDFPKQESVIQFVIEAIQAEAFNPKTLFLIGSYTIGKERLFLEVARVLHRKVYVNAAKHRLLKCLEFSEEDMQWFTMNEQESHIHVVPMWTLASIKRLKHISNQYKSRYSLIVAFSPTGWTFSKGKKKSTGRRWQQGTIIRYEVPYSEHCSFTELREFVKLVSPENIIPSVNNDGPDSTNAMVSLLSS